MSDLNFYMSFVKQLEGSGLSNQEIADVITAQSTRYPSKTMTINELAVAITDAGNPDADGIITRLMSSLEAVSANSFLVANKLEQLKDTANPGVIDLGNYLQRSMLNGFAQDPSLDVQQSDVDAILSLCQVPSPVTAQEVSDAIDANLNYESEQEEAERQRQEAAAIEEENKRVMSVYHALLNEYIAPAMNETVLTEQAIKDALSSLISNWPSN